MRSSDGTFRGEVSRITWDDVPNVTPKNDKRMRQQQDNLYGNTRMTDIQIMYFYKKRNGWAAAIHDDLPFMSIQAIYNRLIELGLPALGRAGSSRVNIEERVRIFQEITEKFGTYASVAKKLGISAQKVRDVCRGLNIAKWITCSIGIRPDVFEHIYKACGKSKRKMSKLTGIPEYAIFRMCNSLKLK